MRLEDARRLEGEELLKIQLLVAVRVKLRKARQVLLGLCCECGRTRCLVVLLLPDRAELLVRERILAGGEIGGHRCGARPPVNRI